MSGYPCARCEGQGWYADHGDPCYAAEECVGHCPVQRQCPDCRGTGRRHGIARNPIDDPEAFAHFDSKGAGA